MAAELALGAGDVAAEPPLWQGLLELPCGQRGRGLGAQLRVRAGRYRARLLGRCTASQLELLPAGDADFEVSGAGTPEVNGRYWLAGERDGAPHYVQPESGVSLVRYRFLPSGRAYWFLSQLDPDGNDRGDLDLYRTAEATEALVPPATGWVVKAGRLPVPTAEPCKPPLLGRRSVGPTVCQRIRFEDVDDVWLEAPYVVLASFPPAGRRGAGAAAVAAAEGAAAAGGARRLELRLCPLAGTDHFAALLRRRLFAARQRSRSQRLPPQAPLRGGAALFADRVLVLDAMGPWLESLGLAAAAALHAASRSLCCLHGLWRSIFTTSARKALALAALHGHSAPVEALGLRHLEGEQPLSSAELRELLGECPWLRSLTVTSQLATIPLLKGCLADALPSLSTLALGSCVQVAPSAVLDLLAAPALTGLRSLTLDAPLAHSCLEEIFLHEGKPDPRLARLLLSSLINVLQGPSPLSEEAPAAEAAAVAAGAAAAERLQWPQLAELLRSIVAGPAAALCHAPAVAGLAAWALGALLAQCSTDVSPRDLVVALRCVLDRIDPGTEVAGAGAPQASVAPAANAPALEGEDLRLAVHAALVLCQTAMLHRTRGVPRSLSAQMIASGALGTLHAVALGAPNDRIVQQRVLCILDLFSYEASDKWPQEEVTRARELCRQALSSPELAEDDAVRFHAEALFVRSGGSAKDALPQQRLTSWKSQLTPGDTVDAMDTEQAAWYEAQVVEAPRPGSDCDASRVKVHFMGWHPRWDAWINLGTEAFRIQRRHRVVRPWRSRLGPMDRLDVKLPEGRTAIELGYERGGDSGRFALPSGAPACSAAHLLDATSRTRWRSGEVLEVRRDGEELLARVVVNGRASAGSRGTSPVLAPSRPPSMATEFMTLGELLQAGIALEFWTDLNGDFVQRAGTHTSRQRPVWGILLRPPKTPHFCPEGGVARWGIDPHSLLT